MAVVVVVPLETDLTEPLPGRWPQLQSGPSSAKPSPDAATHRQDLMNSRLDGSFTVASFATEEAYEEREAVGRVSYFFLLVPSIIAIQFSWCIIIHLPGRRTIIFTINTAVVTLLPQEKQDGLHPSC